MNERELKTVIEAVVQVLASKGLLKTECSGSCSKPPAARSLPTAPPRSAGEVQVTTGSAGKLFGGEWSPETGKKKLSSLAAEEEKPCAKGCTECNPHPELTAEILRRIGADRVGICHPTESCNKIAPLVDHTLLKPGATQEDIAKVCGEARKFCFASVCVNPTYVPLCAKLLAGSGVKVCTVIGFPLGSTTPTVKAIEARDAIANGADEVDMVINVGALKSGNDALAREDIRAVREAARGKVLKVIIETALLTRDEKVRACRISREVGADFVKTSTGFGPGGATAEDVRLMRETVGPLVGVKASGGIKDTAAAQAMIEAGANRLGTSASVAIVTGKKGNGKGY